MKGYFYNKSIRNYISLMINLFNDIYVEKPSGSGYRKVPVTYISKERYFYQREIAARRDEGQAIVKMYAPIITLFLTNMQYDQQRKTNKRKVFNYNKGDSTDKNYEPTPYNLYFDMNIFTRNNTDMFAIIEQIIPYFSPNFNCKVTELDYNDNVFSNKNVPIALDSITTEEQTEGDLADSRLILWNLVFIVEADIFPAPLLDQAGVINDIKLYFSSLNGSSDSDNTEMKEVSATEVSNVLTISYNNNSTTVSNDLNIEYNEDTN